MEKNDDLKLRLSENFLSESSGRESLAHAESTMTCQDFENWRKSDLHEKTAGDGKGSRVEVLGLMKKKIENFFAVIYGDRSHAK